MSYSLHHPGLDSVLQSAQLLLSLVDVLDGFVLDVASLSCILESPSEMTNEKDLSSYR